MASEQDKIAQTLQSMSAVGVRAAQVGKTFEDLQASIGQLAEHIAKLDAKLQMANRSMDANERRKADSIKKELDKAKAVADQADKASTEIAKLGKGAKAAGQGFTRDFKDAGKVLINTIEKNAKEQATIFSSLAKMAVFFEAEYEKMMYATSKGMAGVWFDIQKKTVPLSLTFSELVDVIETSREALNKLGGPKGGLDKFTDLIQQAQPDLRKLGMNAAQAAKTAAAFMNTMSSAGLNGKEMKDNIGGMIDTFSKLQRVTGESAEEMANNIKDIMDNSEMRIWSDKERAARLKNVTEMYKELRVRGMSVDVIKRFNAEIMERFKPGTFNPEEAMKSQLNAREMLGMTAQNALRFGVSGADIIQNQLSNPTSDFNKLVTAYVTADKDQYQSISQSESFMKFMKELTAIEHQIQSTAGKFGYGASVGAAQIPQLASQNQMFKDFREHGALATTISQTTDAEINRKTAEDARINQASKTQQFITSRIDEYKMILDSKIGAFASGLLDATKALGVFNGGVLALARSGVLGPAAMTAAGALALGGVIYGASKLAGNKAPSSVSGTYANATKNLPNSGVSSTMMQKAGDALGMKLSPDDDKYISSTDGASEEMLGRLDYKSHKKVLRHIESSSNYQQGFNQSGFLGGYQMGVQSLMDIGRIDKDYLEKNGMIIKDPALGWIPNKGAGHTQRSILSDDRAWKGVSGYKDWLSKPEEQEKDANRYNSWIYRDLKGKGLIGPSTTSQQISEMMGMSWNQGTGAAYKYLNNGIVGRDGNNTSIVSYGKSVGLSQVKSQAQVIQEITKVNENNQKEEAVKAATDALGNVSVVNKFVQSSQMVSNLPDRMEFITQIDRR